MWALLEARIFNGWRSDILEEILTEQIGRPVDISGDVSVTPGLNMSFLLSNVALPSVDLAGTNFVELERMSLRSNVKDLLQGRPDFFGLIVSGLTVNFVTTEDGLKNWTVDRSSGQSTSSATRKREKAGDPVQAYFRTRNLLNFVMLRSDSFSSVNLHYDNKDSGFVFDFNLEDLTFQRPKDEKLVVASIGTLNDASFDFDGEFRPNGPFNSRATFGDMLLTFDGTSEFVEDDQKFTGQVDFETGEISKFLEMLKMDNAFSGAGAFSAQVHREKNIVGVSELSSTLSFSDGLTVSMEGSVKDVERHEGVDLKLGALFYPEGQEPARAEEVTDLRLLEASARLLGERTSLTVEDAEIRTNFFNQQLEELGPISIGDIRRTDDGLLEMSDVTIEAGPPGAPILKATGRVGDTLRSEDFEFVGQIIAPATLLLSTLDDDVARKFGTVEGNFDIDDDGGFPRLNTFSMHARDTELWSLDLSASTGESGAPVSGTVDFNLGIADSDAFLGALGLKQVGVSPFSIKLFTETRPNGVSSDVEFTAGQSKLSTHLDFKEIEEQRSLNGRIFSSELKLTDVQKLATGIVELNKLDGPRSRGNKGNSSTENDQMDVQPLILPKSEPASDTALSNEPTEQEFPTLEDLLAQEGVQPLVLPETKPDFEELLDLRDELLRTDVDIGIEIEKLTGLQGISSVSSEFVVSQGKALLGPLKIAYGSGFVNAKAAVDVENNPDNVTVSGSTGGWDMGKILESIGVNIGAYGVLSGSFNLTGRNTSVENFINSMRGPVSAKLSQGKIETSLLELAGLGVFPWLFSKERRQNYTEVSCMSAPFSINAGKVSFDNVVLETRKVQLVARGELDWRKDSINLRGEPRPVGRPLSRSAWPFNVTGKLSKPDINLQVGGSRNRRADGASTMPATRQPCVADILQLE